MARRGRSRYEPLDRGYVYCRDTWHTQIFHVDCRAGGAQRVFEDVCRDFERAGWQLGERFFDSRHLRRAGVTWLIQVVSSIESQPLHSTSGHAAGREVDKEPGPQAGNLFQLVPRPKP